MDNIIIQNKQESSNDMLTAMQRLRSGGSTQYLQYTGRNPVIGFKAPWKRGNNCHVLITATMQITADIGKHICNIKIKENIEEYGGYVKFVSQWDRWKHL